MKKGCRNATFNLSSRSFRMETKLRNRFGNPPKKKSCLASLYNRRRRRVPLENNSVRVSSYAFTEIAVRQVQQIVMFRDSRFSRTIAPNARMCLCTVRFKWRPPRVQKKLPQRGSEGSQERGINYVDVRWIAKSGILSGRDLWVCAWLTVCLVRYPSAWPHALCLFRVAISLARLVVRLPVESINCRIWDVVPEKWAAENDGWQWVLRTREFPIPLEVDGQDYSIKILEVWDE